MGTVNVEEIAGLSLCEEVVCAECSTDEEWDAFKEEDVIYQPGTHDRNEDELCFCDRCKERF